MKMRGESGYFHPRPFVGNNIEYRMGSSAALARFKETQSFILGQLALNPFHKFSSSAKEILLLKFDLWFDLLCEIEQYILIVQDNVSFEEIWEMSEARQRYAVDTLREAQEIDQQYFTYYLELTGLLKDYHKNLLTTILGSDLNPASLFGSIVDLSVGALSHILYVVQELDVMMYSNKTPVINLDALSCEVEFSGDYFCPAITRIETYLKIRKFDGIVIKDYVGLAPQFNKTLFHKELNKLGIKYKLI